MKGPSIFSEKKRIVSYTFRVIYSVLRSNIRFLDVTVGEYDRGANDVGARTIQVKHKIIHPEFVPSTLKNDICLLELMDPIKFSDFAQPVCFPPSGSRIDKNVSKQ